MIGKNNAIFTCTFELSAQEIDTTLKIAPDRGNSGSADAKFVQQKFTVLLPCCVMHRSLMAIQHDFDQAQQADDHQNTTDYALELLIIFHNSVMRLEAKHVTNGSDR